jgi:choline dehydrogenase-like flavoprotein
MTELILLGLLYRTKVGGAMISKILSTLFPPKESLYHVYRLKTKSIPVMTGSQARAYMLHLAPRKSSTLWTWEENANYEMRSRRYAWARLQANRG